LVCRSKIENKAAELSDTLPKQLHLEPNGATAVRNKILNFLEN
jgi:hypothetical protein